jgi:hypothetical protein
MLEKSHKSVILKPKLNTDRELESPRFLKDLNNPSVKQK